MIVDEQTDSWAFLYERLGVDAGGSGTATGDD
jgi:prolyl oligopeptidase